MLGPAAIQAEARTGLRQVPSNTQTGSKGNEASGRAKDGFFPPTSEIWDVRGRVQLAAGVFLRAEMCIYGRPDPSLCAEHSLA